jgi:hypothetical protein
VRWSSVGTISLEVFGAEERALDVVLGTDIGGGDISWVECANSV